MDLEQQVVPTLVVSHVSVLQLLVAYFRNSPVEECMEIDIPLHTVIKFTPARGGSWSESIHPLASEVPSIQKQSEAVFENGMIPESAPSTLLSQSGKKKQGMWRKIFGVTSESSPYQSSLDERLHNGLPTHPCS